MLALKYDALKERSKENKLEQSEQAYQEHQANLNAGVNYEELLETQKVANENQYDIQREL